MNYKYKDLEMISASLYIDKAMHKKMRHIAASISVEENRLCSVNELMLDAIKDFIEQNKEYL